MGSAVWYPGGAARGILLCARVIFFLSIWCTCRILWQGLTFTEFVLGREAFGLLRLFGVFCFGVPLPVVLISRATRLGGDLFQGLGDPRQRQAEDSCWVSMGEMWARKTFQICAAIGVYLL